MSKMKTTSKVLLKLPSRMNSGRRGKRARRAVDLGHSLQATPPPPPTHTESPERAKHGSSKYEKLLSDKINFQLDPSVFPKAIAPSPFSPSNNDACVI